MEAFLGQVFLDDSLGMILQVRRHLAALSDTYFHFYILPFALLESFVFHFTHTRPLLQRDDEPDLVALYLLRLDLDAGEQSMLPEAFDSLGDLIARHLYLVSHCEAGETDEDKVVVGISTFHFDRSDLVGLTRIECVFYILCR